MKRQRFRMIVCFITGVTLFFCMSFISAAAEFYLENEWNYVDGSMDISHGIPENATGVMDRIKRKGVLRVATEPYFAPQEFIDPEKTGTDQYAGADMELARLIAARMGVELEIIPMEYTQVLPALTDNLVDLTISAIAFTASRRRRRWNSGTTSPPDRAANPSSPSIRRSIRCPKDITLRKARQPQLL